MSKTNKKRHIHIWSLVICYLTLVFSSSVAWSHLLEKKPTETVKESLKKGIEKTEEIADIAAELSKKFTRKTLKGTGLSLNEMYEAVACVGPVLDMLQKLSENPHDPNAYEQLKHNPCRGRIKEFAYKCINPKILLATAIPYIGVAVSRACDIVEKADDKINKAYEESKQLYEKHEAETCPKEH